MQRSETRILTSHAGSLPRPADLTKLYAQRVRGTSIDAAVLEAAGKEAIHQIVPRQIEAGIDVINNGEQQRESFVLYMRRRLSGLGGEGTRLVAADIDKYPAFKRAQEQANANRFSVSNREHIPKAIGEVRYLDPSLVRAECEDF